MAGEYIIPIGADLEPFVKQLRDGRQAVTGLSDEVTQSSKEMDTAFKMIAQSNAEVVKSLKENTTINRELVKSMVAAVDAGEQQNAQKKEQISIESALNKELEKAIATAKTQLSTLKEGSKEYNKLAKEISAAEVGIRTLGKSGADTNSKMEKLRKTFTENRAVLQNLAAQGLQNTKVYKDLERQTGELADTIKDVNEAINLSGSDTRTLDNLLGSAQAITGAFTVAQGAVALFGDESENLQKALLKVNAALSILNGLQAIQSELKRKDSLASRAAAVAQGAYAAVVGTSTGALKAFRIALASTGIGLIVIAVGALIANFDSIKKKVLELFPGLSTLSDFIGGLVEKFTDFVGITSQAERNLEALEKATANRNKAGERAIEILEAQGGKEKEIYAQRRAMILDDIRLMNEREKVNKGLTDEEFEQRKDLYAKLNALDAGEQKRLNDVAEEKKKKADADRKEAIKKAEEQKAKLLAIEKDQAEKILAFDKQYRDLKIAAIDDEYQRAKALEDARFKDSIDQARKTVAEFKGTDEQRAAIQAAADRVIEQEKVQHFTNLMNLEKDFAERRLKLIANANALANDVFASDLDRELKSINDKYASSIADLEKILANPGGRDKELEALDALNKLKLAKEVETNRARKAARDKAAEENTKSLGKQEQEFKSFSQRINEYFVNAFKNAGLSQSEAEAVFGNIKSVFENLKSAFIDTVDKQIEGKQRQIDALTSQIDEVQDQIDRELELQKQGYANNVGAKQKEFEELQALRKKEAEDEKRLQVEKAKLESLDIARATVQQTVDLGTAAAKIFKAHAGIPFAGVALAAAAVAAMFAGFLAIKSRIKAAQDAVPKFRHGNDLDIDALRGASSHESGGVKMVDNNSGRVLAELEGDEKLFVVNKGASSKYHDALAAINKDDARGAIQAMLKEVGGVHLMEDAPKRILTRGAVVDDVRTKAAAQRSGLATDAKLDEVIAEVRAFKKQQGERPIVIDLGGSVKVMTGNHVKIILKSK